MAMLAEPRRKQKISQDPRNKLWSDDKNKFGKRMLEKMGWETGKGLGANLDGETNHIKVSLKNNTLGVGCSASHDDDWIAHQDDFNDILANLNQDHGKEEDDEEEEKDNRDKSVKSLEERSKKSKNRVHYKKFTRGKDLSKYGTIDIDCILGKRANSAPVTPMTLTPKIQSMDNSDEEGLQEDKSHGVITTTNSTSIQDYFAKKMAEIQKTRQANQEENKVKKSKKDKKKSKRKDKDLNEDDKVSPPEAETGDLSEDRSSRKQKKRKRRDSPDDDGDDKNVEVKEDKSSSSEDVENLEGSPRKKMNKGRTDDDRNSVECDSEKINTSSVTSKKSKKKKKKKSRNVPDSN